MKRYIETKAVSAIPAWCIEGKIYPKGDIVPNSKNRIDGYKVIYEDGYDTWFPKDMFEKIYKVAETPDDQLDIEYERMIGKIIEIQLFINGNKFKNLDTLTQAILIIQEQAMRDYLNALNYRCFQRTEAKADVRFSFDIAIILLRNGFVVRRKAWIDSGLVVFKQIPAHITEEVIPKMQSLPQSAKDLILKSKGYIDYTSQCLIYNKNTGRADSWSPSISDIFVKDWELVV